MKPAIIPRERQGSMASDCGGMDETGRNAQGACCRCDRRSLADLRGQI